MRIEIDRAKLVEICQRFGINLVVLFGSRAKGWDRPGSDYDIAVWFEDCPDEPDLRLETTIWEAFAELLGTDKLDLIVLNRADGALSFEVAYYGVPLYEAFPFAFQKFQLLAVKRYQDMRRIDRWNRLYISEYLRREEDAQRDRDQIEAGRSEEVS